MKRDFNGLEILKAVSESYGELKREIGSFGEKMNDDIAAQVEAAIEACLAAIKAAEAARETRLVESELQIANALSDLAQRKGAALEQIRLALEKLDSSAEERAAALEGMAADIESVLSRHSDFMRQAAEDIAAAISSLKDENKAALDSIADANRLAFAGLADSAAAAGETLVQISAQAQEKALDAIARQEALASAGADALEIELKRKTADDLISIRAEALASIDNALAEIRAANVDSLNFALERIEAGLSEISGAAELHVAAMIGAAAEKALATHPEQFRGDPGLPGEPGERGERGESGQRGLPGRDGQSVEFQGVWKAEHEYRPGDIVVENGATWIARRVTHDEPPSKMANNPHPPWAVVAMRGVKGERGLRGERGDAGARGPAGQAAPAIIALEVMGRELALVLEDGALIKTALPDALILEIAQRAAGYLQGNR